MGQVHVVSGHVREAFYFGGDVERKRLLYAANRRVIESLPLEDDWPPLTRSMFAITEGGDHSPTAPSYRGRVTHFGASYNELLSDVGAWRAKFEALLGRLYWDAAMASIQTEYWGAYALEWNADFAAGEGFREDPPRPTTAWTLEAYRLDTRIDPAELASFASSD